MRERKVIGILVLLSALVLLGTCQLQFNNSAGNSVALQIVLPGNGSGGGKAILSGARSLAGGASVAVTMTGPTGTQQQSVSIGGQASVDISFAVSSSGTYQITANVLDGFGTILSTVSAPLTVPTGNYPVIMRMPSNLLSAVLTSGGAPVTLKPVFSPTTYSYAASPLRPPFALTLATVDPNATITSVTETGVNANFAPFTIVDVPVGSIYALSLQGVPSTTVTIVVTAVDGSVQTYIMTL